MAEINERASTSSDPPPTPAPNTGRISPEMAALSADAFQKVAAYLQGQVEGTIAEYKTLEEMNTVTVQRYKDMKDVAEVANDRLTQLNLKCESLRPYLQQIDEIDENTRRLEQAATALDSYVTALELKLKTLQQDTGDY